MSLSEHFHCNLHSYVMSTGQVHAVMRMRRSPVLRSRIQRSIRKSSNQRLQSVSPGTCYVCQTLLLPPLLPPNSVTTLPTLPARAFFMSTLFALYTAHPSLVCHHFTLPSLSSPSDLASPSSVTTYPPYPPLLPLLILPAFSLPPIYPSCPLLPVCACHTFLCPHCVPSTLPILPSFLHPHFCSLCTVCMFPSTY